jgi:hypothetical protein
MLVSTMLEHLWCEDKPQAISDSQYSPQPKLGGSHHLPPYIIFWTFLWGPHPNGFLSLLKVLKLPRLELSQLCGAIISCSNLRSGWNLKQSCNSRRELSNSVLHTTCTHGSQVNSRLFVVGNQTANLTPGLSFCHNLCCICLNGSCKAHFKHPNFNSFLMI